MIASLGLFLRELLRPGATGPRGGYWFWSGIGSDVSEVALVGGILAALRHRNCHVRRCWRLGHIDPANSHPACRRHHSRRHLLGDAPES